MERNRAYCVYFDETATTIMGTVFDRACSAFPDLATTAVRNSLAQRIVDDATFGERDGDLLYAHAIELFGVVDFEPFMNTTRGSSFRLRLGPRPTTHWMLRKARK